MSSDPVDGIRRTCVARELEHLTARGWTVLSHYQETALESTQEAEQTVHPQPQMNGYPPTSMTYAGAFDPQTGRSYPPPIIGNPSNASMIVLTRYYPVTRTVFLLKKSFDQTLNETREALNRETERAGSLEAQLELLLKSHGEQVNRLTESAKECDRLREIVAEPKVAVESLGLSAWADEVKRLFKTVTSKDCDVSIRQSMDRWYAKVSVGADSSERTNGASPEAAAESMLVHMRKLLRDHIDKKKVELDELSTIENVAAVNMVLPTLNDDAKERMPF